MVNMPSESIQAEYSVGVERQRPAILDFNTHHFALDVAQTILAGIPPASTAFCSTLQFLVLSQQLCRLCLQRRDLL